MSRASDADLHWWSPLGTCQTERNANRQHGELVSKSDTMFRRPMFPRTVKQLFFSVINSISGPMALLGQEKNSNEISDSITEKTMNLISDKSAEISKFVCT
jgi:hypothetical protein